MRLPRRISSISSEFTRRGFLRVTAGAAAALSLGPGLTDRSSALAGPVADAAERRGGAEQWLRAHQPVSFAPARS